MAFAILLVLFYFLYNHLIAMSSNEVKFLSHITKCADLHKPQYAWIVLVSWFWDQI